jgi:hypothetical protein
MGIAQGVVKQTRIKRQTAKGTIAPAATGGKIVRRETSTFEQRKETYTTESEITSTQQLLSNRHGVQLVDGKLNGILSGGTYTDELAALMRKDTAAGATTGAIITVAAAVTTGYAGTFTRSAGSFFTDGFKVGQIVRCTGWATTGVANNNKNFLITALTATVMTVLSLVPVAVGAKAAGDSVTISTPGKITYIPNSGHTNIYHTVEEWSSDVPRSEVYSDIQVASADITIPGSGNAKVAFAFTGLVTSPATAGVYFVSPTAETTSDAVASATGALFVNGVQQAIITNIQFKIDGKVAPAEGVVGTNIRPDVFRGKVMVTGSFTAYYDSGTVPDVFTNESVISILVALSSGSDALSEVITFSMPTVKLNSASPDDSETGLKRTYNFVAQYNSAGGVNLANHATTLQMHDTLAP